MGYFFLFILFLVLIFSVAGFYTAYNIGHNKKKADYDIREYNYPWHEPGYEIKIKQWIKTLSLDYENIRSPYLYKLNTLSIVNNENAKWVIILHGVTLNHKALMDFAYMYSQLNYNVLLWDSRNHGDSEGENITYGYYEKNDLRAVVDWLRKKYGNKTKIGLHGVSMGSGILLSYATGVRDDCQFYIADCPYSNFKKQVADVTKTTIKVPDFIISIIMVFTTFFVKLLFKFDLGKINIADKIHRVENPILFLNCKDDDYIDPSMTQELYDKCVSVKKSITWFDEGKHGGAFGKNREIYIKAVKKFLDSIDF